MKNKITLLLLLLVLFSCDKEEIIFPCNCEEKLFIPTETGKLRPTDWREVPCTNEVYLEDLNNGTLRTIKCE